MRHSRNKLFLVVVCATGCLVSASAAGPAPAGPPPVARARWLMGTLCEIRAFGPPAATGAALDAALDRIEQLERALTTWTPEGELARLNAACAAGDGAERPLPVSADLGRALALARDWAARTGGAFDPTIGALADAWGLRSGGRTPPADEIVAARARTGWERFGVSADGRAVRCAPGTRFDLGGLGKGFALDEAAALLRARGVGRALLDFGGQLLTLGPPPGAAAWPVPIDGTAEVHGLRDASLATSGTGERGRHILDPRTGRPVPRTGNVRVVAPTATAADALSTAAFVAGPAARARLGGPGIDIVFFDPQSPRSAHTHWKGTHR